MSNRAPRIVSPADIAPMADYLVSGYWREAENRSGFHFNMRADNVITVNLTGLDATGRALARGALESWEMVADLDFREVASGGQITFSDNGPNAYTGFTFGGPTGLTAARVNIGTGWIDKYGTIVGAFSFHSYIHEIGHALGLGHAGNYDGSIPTWPKGVEFAEDSWQRSVMSYYGQDQNPNIDANRAAVIAPQMADIAAIQAIYGAARGGETAGDTVWGVGSTLDNYLGRYFRDGYVMGQYLPFAATFTIWDEGGIDTVDLSHHGKDQTVSLMSGAVWDTIGLKGNIMIMPGTVIEHFNAGRGNDRIWGNDVANRINANNGDDTVLGGAGNDRLNGGTGNDRLEGEAGDDSLIGDLGEDVILGGAGNDRIDAGGMDDRVDGGAGQDSILGDTGADNLAGGDGNDRMDGGAQDDRLSGGAGDDRLWGDVGNDILTGGAGNDRLDGGKGHDRMTGDAGADVFVFNGGDDAVTDFTRADRLEIDRTLARDGSLSLAEVDAALGLTRAGLMIDFGGRGTLVIEGFTDRAALLDRIDIV
jgi:serralysin